MSKPAKFISDPDLGALVEGQEQVLSRTQADAHGIGSQHIARRVASGQWQLVGARVVVLHGGPLSLSQKQWSAVLHAGDEGALFGATALQAAGLRGLETSVLHVVAPHGKGRRDLDTPSLTVEVHESIDLGPEAIAPLRTPRRQRVPRAAVDAAATSPTDGACRAVLAAVVQQRLARAEDLRAYPERTRTLARRRLILETIDDVAGGAQSLPEMEWNRGIRKAGLPEPTRQRTVERAGGHYYLDADFDPWQVTVEINGSQHLDLLARDADDDRRFVLSAAGRLVVDIVSHVVRRDNDRAVLRTARGLYARGWRPEAAVLKGLEQMAARKRQPLWLPELIFPDQSASA